MGIHIGFITTVGHRIGLPSITESGRIDRHLDTQHRRHPDSLHRPRNLYRPDILRIVAGPVDADFTASTVVIHHGMHHMPDRTPIRHRRQCLTTTFRLAVEGVLRTGLTLTF